MGTEHQENQQMIEAHGGDLVEQFMPAEELDRITAETGKEIALTDRLVFDAFMIAMGGFSPLTGFVSEADYNGIIDSMHLESGALFAIPIVLPVDEATYQGIGDNETLVLADGDGNKLGIVVVSGKFRRNLQREAQGVYKTTDTAHPGVQKIYEEGEYAVAGDIRLVKERVSIEFPDNFLTPAETRKHFEAKGCETIVAFQTRNPIHRAHEYLTKISLEMVDALMIHPIVGEVKADDIPAPVRMSCYKVLIDNYYNADRVLLNILPMAMRYAGPREAIHHAIVRQNYGMTHIIIGRDHAGVGDYYGTYDAQGIFDTIGADELHIVPLKFEHAFFCNDCGQMVTAKTCPHDSRSHVFLSGTKVRQKLRDGEDLPNEFTRREVSDVLQAWIQE